MADCDDNTTELREDPEIPGGGDEMMPEEGDAELVEFPTEKRDLTARADFDVHTAITMGLASYILQLDGDISGRSCRFKIVTSDWADYDNGSPGMPSAAVHSEEDGSYRTDSGMGPGGKPIVIGDKSDPLHVPALVGTGIYTLAELKVDVWCPDKQLRAGVRRMLEDAFSPVHWMSGFRLWLARYHSAVATFLVTSAKLNDSAESAIRELRPMTFNLRAQCPTYRLHRLPLARPLVSGTIAT